MVFPRSSCPQCKSNIAWYDLIPIFSWIWLRGQCRQCLGKISLLYPFIEILTPLVMIPLILWAQPVYLPAYFFLFSALIITIRSDIEHMLISRFVTLFLIPIGFILSALDLLPLTIWESILGALLGYGFLFAIASLFRLITKKEGMGQGDLELLAFIGSFTGIFGFWISLLFGSLMGSLYGLANIVVTHKKTSVKIPFGPFLALGAIIYVLWQEILIDFLFSTH